MLIFQALVKSVSSLSQRLDTIDDLSKEGIVSKADLSRVDSDQNVVRELSNISVSHSLVISSAKSIRSALGILSGTLTRNASFTSGRIVSGSLTRDASFTSGRIVSGSLTRDASFASGAGRQNSFILTIETETVAERHTENPSESDLSSADLSLGVSRYFFWSGDRRYY